MSPTLGLFLSIGAVFGLLAAASAYTIAYHEYRQRMLRVDQNARRMALEVATVTFVFIMAASFVLYFELKP
jgi:uncharacterized membrane protein YbhN (UPF0104 family)